MDCILSRPPEIQEHPAGLLLLSPPLGVRFPLALLALESTPATFVEVARWIAILVTNRTIVYFYYLPFSHLVSPLQRYSAYNSALFFPLPRPESAEGDQPQ